MSARERFNRAVGVLGFWIAIVAAAAVLAIEAYRVARDAWVRLVAGPAEADLVGEPAGAMPAPADPANCRACGHRHATEGMAAICVGCPCEGAKA